MRLLALDLGATTGWAVSGATVIADTWDIRPRDGESPGIRLLRLRSNLNATRMAFPDLKLVVYEAIHVQHANAALSLGRLEGIVQEWAADHGLEIMKVQPGTVKRFATGKGNAKKDAMVAAARKAGWDVKDDNEADARWLLAYAMTVVGKEP